MEPKQDTTHTVGAAGSSGVRARRTRETHERIYRTARRLFAERGFAATRVQDIADELGLSTVTIFNHFGSKNALLQNVATEYLGHFEELLQEIRDLAANGSHDAETTLAVAERRFRRMPPIPRRLATDALAMVLGEPAGAAVSAKLRELLGELVALAQERGQARTDLPPQQLAGAVSNQILGAFVAWMNDEELDAEALSAEVFIVVSDIMRPRSPR